MLSSGERKEMLVLSFCRALFEIDCAHEDGVVPLSELLSAEDFLNVNPIIKRLSAEIKSVYEQYMTPDDLLWMRKRLDKSLVPTLSFIGNMAVQPEVLSLYVLYVNFCDNRSKKLSDIFVPFTEEKDYFKLLDVIEKQSDDGMSESMYQLAYECVERLKR